MSLAGLFNYPSVPKLFDTSHWFHGRQFFHRQRGGVVQVIMWAMREIMQATMKLIGSSRWSFTHLPATYHLLCSPVPSRGSGTPIITHETRWILPTAFCSLPVFLKCPFIYLFFFPFSKQKWRRGQVTPLSLSFVKDLDWTAHSDPVSNVPDLLRKCHPRLLSHPFAF